jgi:glycosyltransferase involved in cell wall biosynthesis
MITIISLAWNQYNITKEFLERLKRYTDIEHELIFTDNGSVEPISDLVREIYPNAILIREDKNIGCPATRNKSMEFAKSDIVFWLDNDTMVDSGWYIPFLNNLKAHVGITGIDGRRVGRPFKTKTMNPWVTDPYLRCDWFAGYAVAFQRKAYRPIDDWGLMVGMDDVDLGVGIKKNGYTTRTIFEKVQLTHLGGTTSKLVQPSVDQQRDALLRWWKYWGKYKYILFGEYYY